MAIKRTIDVGGMMELVWLKNSTARVAIAPALGGSIVHFDTVINGERYNIFRSRLSAEHVLESACFPLVPFSNRIAHGKMFWQGREHKLELNNLPERHAIHGHGWQQPWQVVESSADKLVLRYNHQSGEQGWPFEYVAEQEFYLQANELKLCLKVSNLSSDTMPSGLGLHPYFVADQDTYVMSQVQQMWLVDDESMPTKIGAAPADIASAQGMQVLASSLDNAFINFPHQASIQWRNKGLEAKVTTSSNCICMVIYSPDNQDFFCLEPVTHCTDAVNKLAQGEQGTGVYSLAPNSEQVMTMAIAVAAMV